MKSSDYFSKVYEPQTSNIDSYWNQRAAIKAEKEAQLENMLDWMYDATERAFRLIPEATLRSFMPEYIDFLFYHKKPGKYILAQLVKYRDEKDSYGDLLPSIKKIQLQFKDFESVPKVYRDTWDDWHCPSTQLINGYFKAMSGFIDTGSPKDVGKYKAVYEYVDTLEKSIFRYYKRKL